MVASESLKTAFEHTAKAFDEKPSLTQKTGRVKVHSENGLACKIESGPWKFKTDMPKPVGGTATAPPPGIYEAGALGSCIAIMTRMWAAKWEVPIDSLEVEVEFEADKRFLFDLGGVSPRWSTIRYHVSVESPAPKEEVMKVLDKVHQQSYVRGDYEFKHKIKRKVTLS